MYWMNVLAGLDGMDEFGSVFINRLLNQDIMVIVILAAMFLLEAHLFRRANTSKLLTNVKLYSVGLVIYLALIKTVTKRIHTILFALQPLNTFSPKAGENVSPHHFATQNGA